MLDAHALRAHQTPFELGAVEDYGLLEAKFFWSTTVAAGRVYVCVCVCSYTETDTLPHVFSVGTQA